ncbi:hypothetical protein P279_28505 [Rhodobacteraceae bacterium PD-2]|nr:hypothetical protein P279_28505 [Rhodobacteraceae bacterium PD-2]
MGIVVVVVAVLAYVIFGTGGEPVTAPADDVNVTIQGDAPAATAPAADAPAATAPADAPEAAAPAADDAAPAADPEAAAPAADQ